MTNLEQLVKHAMGLLVVDDNSREAVATQSKISKLPNLKTQIQELTAQVGALTTQKSIKKPIQCFFCSAGRRHSMILPQQSQRTAVL